MRKYRNFVLGAALCLSLLNGCAPSVGNAPSSGTWESWDQIEGQLRPEISLSSNTPISNPHLKAVTFNVHHGENVDEIANAIRGDSALSNADVILLQEIQSFPNEPGSRASRLATALSMNYVYAPARPFENGTHGIAILSPHPLSNISVMELPAGEMVVDNERRIALSADLTTASGPIRVITVHLDTRLNAPERILQLRPAVIDAPTPVIVGGDFNTNPLFWAFNVVPVIPPNTTGVTDQAPILDDYMRSIGFQTPTAELGETVPFPGFKPRLDSIYIRGLNSVQGGVERNISVSDHWPLWLEVNTGR